MVHGVNNNPSSVLLFVIRYRGRLFKITRTKSLWENASHIKKKRRSQKRTQRNSFLAAGARAPAVFLSLFFVGNGYRVCGHIPFFLKRESQWQHRRLTPRGTHPPPASPKSALSAMACTWHRMEGGAVGVRAQRNAKSCTQRVSVSPHTQTNNAVFSPRHTSCGGDILCTSS